MYLHKTLKCLKIDRKDYPFSYLGQLIGVYPFSEYSESLLDVSGTTDVKKLSLR